MRDLKKSIRFYQAALAPLGYELGSSGDGYAGFGPPGAPALWLYAHDGDIGPGTHVAFRPVRGRTTAPTTTPGSWSTPTVTTWKP